MPGPQHNNEKRTSGARPDPQGNARKAERKQSKRLAARVEAFNPGKAGEGLLCHKPGSQNRKK